MTDSTEQPSKKITRRRLLVKGFRTIVGLSLAALVEGEREVDAFQVTHVDVPLARWPRGAGTLRIGLISDFHADTKHDVERTGRAARLVMEQKPDLVVLGGDYVTSHFQRRLLPAAIEALYPCAAAPRGAFAIMGNHDHWGNNAQFATAHLAKGGICVLNNRSVPIPGTDGLYLVGVDDPWCRKMDLARAVSGIPEGAVKILAMHEPDFADTIGPGFELQLSGHSHGGQIRIPWLPVLHTPKYGHKYPEGLQRAPHHWVYTTRGVGTVGPPIRLFCPPEITLLELHSKAYS